MWQRFRVLRVRCQKVSLNRRPIAYTVGRGSHPTPFTWYGNRLSTQHSRWVIRLTWRTARNFLFYTWMHYTTFYNNYFGSGEDDLKPGSIPWRYKNDKQKTEFLYVHLYSFFFNKICTNPQFIFCEIHKWIGVPSVHLKVLHQISFFVYQIIQYYSNRHVCEVAGTKIVLRLWTK